MGRALPALLVLCLGGCGTPPPPTSPPRSAAREQTARPAGPRLLPGSLRRKGLRVAGTVIGHDDAAVRIDLYTDFQCAFCARVHRTLAELARRYPADLQLRHHDYPLDPACNPKITAPSFHDKACSAAYFARCAARQRRFWDFSALVFEQQDSLSRGDLLDLGRQLGLDLEALAACVDQVATHRAVLEDIKHAIRHRVTGTPTALVNLRGKEVERVVGARSAEWWSDAVEQLISRATAQRK